MILQRVNYTERGIFGTLRTDEDFEVCKTLEHAYERATGTFFPKIPSGNFECVRGVHSLANGPPFETFEITGVFGHTGLLFHTGNYNEQSKGCVLLGQAISHHMIIRSVTAFAEFMNLMKGVTSFSLVVT